MMKIGLIMKLSVASKTILILMLLSVDTDSGLCGEKPKYKWSIGTDLSARYDLSNTWAIEFEPDIFLRSKTQPTSGETYRRLGAIISGIKTISTKGKLRLNGRSTLGWSRDWTRVTVALDDPFTPTQYSSETIRLDRLSADLAIDLEFHIPFWRGLVLSTRLLGASFRYSEGADISSARGRDANDGVITGKNYNRTWNLNATGRAFIFVARVYL